MGDKKITKCNCVMWFSFSYLLIWQTGIHFKHWNLFEWGAAMSCFILHTVLNTLIHAFTCSECTPKAAAQWARVHMCCTTSHMWSWKSLKTYTVNMTVFPWNYTAEQHHSRCIYGMSRQTGCKSGPWVTDRRMDQLSENTLKIDFRELVVPWQDLFFPFCNHQSENYSRFNKTTTSDDRVEQECSLIKSHMTQVACQQQQCAINHLLATLSLRQTLCAVGLWAFKAFHVANQIKRMSSQQEEWFQLTTAWQPLTREKSKWKKLFDLSLSKVKIKISLRGNESHAGTGL